MLEITTNNKGKGLVAPLVPVSSKKDLSEANFNYNTYLRLTPLFKSLIVSSTSNGEYNLKVNDFKNGFFFEYIELNLFIKVPLTVIFNTNDKIKGILGICYSTAKNCPSHNLGLCQLPDGEVCYARQGEKQGSKKVYCYLKGMGSYFKGLLSVYYWELFKKDPLTRLTLIRYLNFYNIDILRFNLKGDFKDLSDILTLNYLANSKKGLKLYGYTARDDLYTPLIELITNNRNIKLNGSNIKYNNRFYCTSDLKEYLTAKHPCRGGCLKNNCLNCLNLNNALITVLIHGAGSDSYLKNESNINLIVEVFKKYYNIDLSEAFKLNLKGLVSCINKYLITTGLYKSLDLNSADFKYSRAGNLVKVMTIKDLLDLIKKTGEF